MIQCRRAYEPAQAHDGYRVLVDRLWPRGIKKESLVMDDWQKDVAPSTELRQRFGHDPAHFDDFKRHYLEELRAHPDNWEPLLNAAKKGNLTLLYSAHDETHNNAVVLAEFLQEKLHA